MGVSKEIFKAHFFSILVSLVVTLFLILSNLSQGNEARQGDYMFLGIHILIHFLVLILSSTIYFWNIKKVFNSCCLKWIVAYVGVMIVPGVVLCHIVFKIIDREEVHDHDITTVITFLVLISVWSIFIDALDKKIKSVI